MDFVQEVQLTLATYFKTSPLIYSAFISMMEFEIEQVFDTKQLHLAYVVHKEIEIY